MIILATPRRRIRILAVALSLSASGCMISMRCVMSADRGPLAAGGMSIVLLLESSQKHSERGQLALPRRRSDSEKSSAPGESRAHFTPRPADEAAGRESREQLGHFICSPSSTVALRPPVHLQAGEE